MRGIIYCVHLYGIGHLKRMLTLAKGLAKDCDITLIQAGRDERVSFLHPNFRHIGIPLPRAITSLIVNKDYDNFEKLMKMRRKQLFKVMDFSHHYDFMITEQIPFTKLAFTYEAYSIMNAIKIKNPNLAMISSHKGGNPFQVEGAAGAEVLSDEGLQKISWETTLNELKTHYDKVLLHFDPQVTSLNESFGYFDEIKDMIEYTGYIFPRLDKYPPSTARKKVILVTTGSGSKGIPLLLSLLRVVPEIPEYSFQFVVSSAMRGDLLKLLNEEAEQIENMETVGFLENFDEKLRQCSLAITLAGSTLINLYATSTPGLVYPDPFDLGQLMLGKKFADLGIVNLIDKTDLSPEKLHKLIIETIKNPPKSDIELNIGGVKNSIQAIYQVVEEKRRLAKEYYRNKVW